jgi:membrane-associated phospholipid phosphatase
MLDARGTRPIDIAMLSYLAVEIVLVSVFMFARPGWLYLIGVYVAAATLTFIITRIHFDALLWKTIQIIYPLIMITFLYEAMNYQIFMIHGRPFDSQINSLEMSLFGADISFWLQPHMTIWRNEIMSLSYMSYYFLVPVSAYILVVHGKWNSLERMVLAASITYYISYLIFIFYPVLGPRIYLENIFYLPFDGPLFTPLVSKIVEKGGLFGGAMPSSHCAVALVAVIFLIREIKDAAIPLLSVLLLLCISTVYGRFHYATDVIVGLFLGAVVLGLSSLWQNRYPAAETSLFRLTGAEKEQALEAGVDQWASKRGFLS